MVEPHQSGLGLLEPAKHQFHLFPVCHQRLAVVALHGRVPIDELTSAVVFLSQSGQAADGDPPCHHGQIGRQARPPRKAAEHRSIVVQNFEQDVCQQIIAIGRRQGHLSLDSGAIDDEGEQATKPRHERIPSLRQSLQALLDESPILR